MKIGPEGSEVIENSVFGVIKVVGKTKRVLRG